MITDAHALIDQLPDIRREEAEREHSSTTDAYAAGYLAGLADGGDQVVRHLHRQPEFPAALLRSAQITAELGR